MRHLGASIIGGSCVAGLLFACSSTPSNSGSNGGSSGSGATSTSGSAGMPGSTTGGSTGSATGGTTGSTTGGTTGSPGGSAGMPGGGSAGMAAGGSAGMAAGGSAGAAGGSGPMLTLPLLVTSSSSALWQPGTITAASGGTATITVNDSQMKQKFFGFGGAFNEKGWSFLSQLSADDQAKAMKLLFDATDGANFQYGRIPIGANDYSVTMYSDDDGDDTSLAKFSIDEDKKYIIPYIKAAMAINPNIHFWGSPWSPPGWMKTGGDGTMSLNHGTMKNDSATLTAYASYFVKWVQAYAAENIKIESVAPQNEPNYSEAYPSCQWKGADYAKFVGQFLGPALKTASLDTTILLGTMSRNDTNTGTNESDQSVVTAVLGDSTAMGFIKGFGLQWNMMQSGAFIPSGVGSSSLPKWQSEHKCGNYSWGGAAYGQTYNSSKAPNDFGYAEESWGNIHDWLTAGVSVYSAWNMVLDPNGMSVANWPQDTLIVADPSTKMLSPKPAYYAFRHFSQYTQPGATRVATTGDVSCSGDGIGKCGNGVAAIAFKNPDNTHVVVLFNNGSGAAQVTLGIGSTNLQFMMAASSFATVVN